MFPLENRACAFSTTSEWIILAQSQDQLCEHMDLVLSHLSQLGLRVNWEKSKLSRCRRSVTLLGLLHMRPLQHWLHGRVPRLAPGLNQSGLPPILEFLASIFRNWIVISQVAMRALVTTPSQVCWLLRKVTGW